MIFASSVRVIEDAGSTVIEGNGNGVYAGLLLDQAFNSVGAAAAAHALDLQGDRLHVIALHPRPDGHIP